MNHPTLTLAQLREDIERLASAHPACYPTNVIDVTHQCGEICVDSENEEDALREELKAQEEATSDAEKEVQEWKDKAQVQESEIESLRVEMSEIRDTLNPDESIISYRERAQTAEKRTEEYCQFMCDARHQVEETERECKALRARKGVSAGVYKNIQKIRTFLSTVIHSSTHQPTADMAATILREIQTT